MKVENIPPAVEAPKKNRRVKVLAKMLLKEVRGPKNKSPATPQQSLATAVDHSGYGNLGPATSGVSEPVKIKKPRKPPTEKMLDWRKTFAEVRKRHPGRRTPEFDAALRQASTSYKQRWANRVN
jgi:hypothetical protein